jgi:hypothetical protein
MSSTGNFTSDYIRHTYKVKSELKDYMIYELSASEQKRNLLADILRIKQFQGKSLTTRVDACLKLEPTKELDTSAISYRIATYFQQKFI